MNKRLLLVRGLPGAGKSTFVKDMFPGITTCEADQYWDEFKIPFDKTLLRQAHAYCYGKVSSKMSMDLELVIVSNTFTQEWEMDAYFELAGLYGYEVTTIIVENRNEYRSIHNVPDETISAMRERFQVKL